MAWDDVAGISFDLGGTLIHDERGPATGEIADLLGVGLPQMRVHLGRDAKRDRESPSGLAHRLATEFARPHVTGALTRLLEQRRAHCEAPNLVPHAEPVLAELRRRGYRISFLSNVLGAIAPRPDSLPFFRLADAVLMSCDTGYVKPEREAFAQVEHALDVGPHQLAHVGDSYGADVCGALASGWHAVHIDATNPATLLLGPEIGDGAACRMADLPALLGLFRKAPPRLASTDGGTGK